MWSSGTLNQLRYPELMGYINIVEEKRGLTAASLPTEVHWAKTEFHRKQWRKEIKSAKHERLTYI